MLNDNSHMLPSCHLAPAAAPTGCREGSSHGKNPRPPRLAGKDEQTPSDKRRRTAAVATPALKTRLPDAPTIPDELGCSRNTAAAVNLSKHAAAASMRRGEMHCGIPSWIKWPQRDHVWENCARDFANFGVRERRVLL